jgi:hypothetical protein
MRRQLVELGSIMGVRWSMAKKKRDPEQEPKAGEKSQGDRAPYQKNADRDPVKSVEETRDIPSQGHGAVK